MRLTLAVAGFAAAIYGAVEGTVQNLTTGQRQEGAVVTLVSLGSGMNNLGSVKSSADGRFRFDVSMQPSTPYLIQALHQGVTYNQMLQPGAAASGISLAVYDASTQTTEAKVVQHMILLEPSGTELAVNESVIFSNTGKTTYQDPQGTLKIYVPSTVNVPVRVRITAPQGMPISREAEKGAASNTYVVRYPIKPGETRIDLMYAMPAGSPFQYQGKILHGGGPVRFIAPQGVKLASTALTDLGPEPRTQAGVYELKGTEFAIDIEGTGSLRAPAGASESASAAGEGESDAPGIDMAKPRIYRKLLPVLGLAFAMLAVGFGIMYRAGASNA